MPFIQQLNSNQCYPIENAFSYFQNPLWIYLPLVLKQKKKNIGIDSYVCRKAVRRVVVIGKLFNRIIHIFFNSSSLVLLLNFYRSSMTCFVT